MPIAEKDFSGCTDARHRQCLLDRGFRTHARVDWSAGAQRNEKH